MITSLMMMDNDDEEPQVDESSWRAKELRRRVGNRRRHGASRVVALDELSAAEQAKAGVAPQVQRAVEDSRSIQLAIVDRQLCDRHVTLATSQQFHIGQRLHSLTSSLTKSKSTLRAKTSRLSCLETKLQVMSEELHGDVLTTSQRITKSATAMHRACHGNLTPCSLCGKVLLGSLILSHESSCPGRSTCHHFPYDHEEDQKFQKCQNCHGEFLQPAFGAHVCRVPAPVRYPEPPHPPSNLRLSNVACDGFILQWDAPIFTAGEPILAYEITYGCLVSTHLSTKSTWTPCRAIQSVAWVKRNPVSPAFHFTNCSGDTTYGRFQVQAFTRCGGSKLMSCGQEIRTLVPEPPSCPLFPFVSASTCSSISLEWDPPFRLNGGSVVNYEVRYRGQVGPTTSETKGFLKITPTPEVTLDNIRRGTSISHVTVVAVNHLGMKSEPSEPLVELSTPPQAKGFGLVDELEAALEAEDHVQSVDSEFQHPGVSQRYDRQVFIQLMSRHIQQRFPQWHDRVEALLEAHRTLESDSEEDSSDSDSESSEADSEAESSEAGSEAESSEEPREESLEQESGKTPKTEPDTEAGASSTAKTEPDTEAGAPNDIPSIESLHEERQAQFQYRLARLRDAISNATYNVQWCKDRRGDLMGLMGTAERRLLDKQSELTRARDFRGEFMDSDVLHGALQRFNTRAYVDTLEEELEIEKFYIAETKEECRDMEHQLLEDMQTLVRTQEKYRERQEAYERFQEQVKLQASGQKVLSTLFRETTSSLASHWNHWRNIVRDQRQRRDQQILPMSRMCDLRRTFRTWKAAAEVSKGTRVPTLVTGRGGRELKASQDARKQLEEACHGLLSQVASMEKDLGATRQTSAQRQIVEGQSAFSDQVQEAHYEMLHSPEWQLYRQGKAQIKAGNARKALDSLERQLSIFTSIEDTTTTSTVEKQNQMNGQARCYAAMGQAYLHLCQIDHAILKLNQGCRLANLTQDRLTLALVYHALGQAYEEASDGTSQSLLAYEHSLSAYEELGDLRGQLACLRGLEAGYDTLGDQENKVGMRDRADVLEFELEQTFAACTSSLDDMSAKLRSISAQPQKTSVIERVSPLVPKLRHERLKIRAEMRALEEDQALIEQLLQDKQALVTEGQEDLRLALSSAATVVSSRSLSGALAQYPVEFFRPRIQKLLAQLREATRVIGQELENAKIRVRNAASEVEDLEAQLCVETGPLMTQVIANALPKTYRVVAMNRLNIDLDDVCGQKGGLSTFVVAKGDSFQKIGLATGCCLGIQLGEREHPVRAFDTQRRGHRQSINVMVYAPSRVITGGQDGAIGVYRHTPDTPDFALEGWIERELDAAVTALAVDSQVIVAACADCDLFLFSATNFVLLLRLTQAHVRSITCLSLSHSRTLVSGAGDGEVGVWRVCDLRADSASKSPVEETHNHHHHPFTQKGQVKLVKERTLKSERKAKTKTQTSSLFERGHVHPVTCLESNGTEIVSGDRAGFIVCWNVSLSRGQEFRQCLDVHQHKSVLSLQFDTTKIVSAGLDHCIAVSDLASGQVLQRLAGHTCRILSIQFDPVQLLSVSEDGQMRLWCWSRTEEASSSGDTTTTTGGGSSKIFHLLGPGETLASIAIEYQVSVRDLREWNTSMTLAPQQPPQWYVGQRIVVYQRSPASQDLELDRVYGQSEELLNAVGALPRVSLAQRTKELSERFFPVIKSSSPSDLEEQHLEEEEEATTSSIEKQESSEEDDSSTSSHSGEEESEESGSEEEEDSN